MHGRSVESEAGMAMTSDCSINHHRPSRPFSPAQRRRLSVAHTDTHDTHTHTHVHTHEDTNAHADTQAYTERHTLPGCLPLNRHTWHGTG